MATGDLAPNFPITSGVRQGCVLSPRLFSALLYWDMKGWRRDAPLKGFDLWDGQPALLDLRFADDIPLFAKSYVEQFHSTRFGHCAVASWFDTQCEQDLTNEAQPPHHLQLPSEERIAILEHDSGQKWFGCILTAQGSKLYHVDMKQFAAGIQSILRKPLDPERPRSIDCDKAEILRQGGDYRGMLCSWTSGLYKKRFGEHGRVLQETMADKLLDLHLAQIGV